MVAVKRSSEERREGWRLSVHPSRGLRVQVDHQLLEVCGLASDPAGGACRGVEQQRDGAGARRISGAAAAVEAKKKAEARRVAIEAAAAEAKKKRDAQRAIAAAEAKKKAEARRAAIEAAAAEEKKKRDARRAAAEAAKKKKSKPK